MKIFLMVPLFLLRLSQNLQAVQVQLAVCVMLFSDALFLAASFPLWGSCECLAEGLA